MRNKFLVRFAEPLTVKAANVLLLIGVVAVLLATPVISFAKANTGKKQQITDTATFLGIGQHFYNEALYPHDTNIQDLVIGDTLDVMVGTQIVPGVYLGSNTVYANKQVMNLKASANLQSAPILDLQPLSMSFIGSRDCPQATLQNATVFVCQARVSSQRNAQGNLNWFAYEDFSGKVIFNPPSGSLAPNSSVIIKVEIPIDACTPGLFYFQGLRNTHTITWACKPKTVNPA
jgi:hypothetical protein